MFRQQRPWYRRSIGCGFGKTIRCLHVARGNRNVDICPHHASQATSAKCRSIDCAEVIIEDSNKRRSPDGSPARLPRIIQRITLNTPAERHKLVPERAINIVE